MSEANARIIIDKLLRDSDWVLSGDDGIVNVDTELQNASGFADYVLKDSSDFPLCVKRKVYFSGRFTDRKVSKVSLR